MNWEAMGPSFSSRTLSEVVHMLAEPGWGAQQSITPSPRARGTWLRHIEYLPRRYREEWRARFEQMPRSITRADIYELAEQRQWPQFYLALWLWGTGSRPRGHPARLVPKLPSLRWAWFDDVSEAARSDLAEAVVVVRDSGPHGLGVSFGTKVLHFAAPDVAAIHDANTWKAYTAAADGDPDAPHPFRDARAAALSESYAAWCSRVFALAHADPRDLSVADVERACFTWGQSLPD